MVDKVSTLKERARELRDDEKFVSAEVVAVEAQLDRLNVELDSRKKELEKSQATSAAKAYFIELFKGHIAKKVASFARGRKGLEKKLVEAREMSIEALMEMRADRDRMREEVDQFSSVMGTPSVEETKA